MTHAAGADEVVREEAGVMRVHVRLFAALADLAGTREVALELPDGATGEELFAALSGLYPRMGALRASLRLAVNREYVGWSHPLRPDDEIALIPPVSGGEEADGENGAQLPYVAIVTEPLSADEYQRLVISPECGAVALFVGVVREFTGPERRRTVLLEYEAYHEMAEREMRKVAEEIVERWPGARVAIGHRVGRLAIGEASVIVAVATPHRAEAFEAARYGIDTLKERVPIWKKEVWDDGECWVGIHA